MVYASRGRPYARLAAPSADACDGRAAPAPDMSEPGGSETLGIATAPSAGCNEPAESSRFCAGGVSPAYVLEECFTFAGRLP